MVLDSRSIYPIFLGISVIAIINHWPLLFYPLTLLVFIPMLVNVFTMKSNYRYNLKIIIYIILTDGALMLYLTLTLPAFGLFFVVIPVFYWIVLIIFYYTIKREVKIISRPIFTMNDDDAYRARKAMITRHPEDIINIQKYKKFS